MISTAFINNLTAEWGIRFGCERFSLPQLQGYA